MQGTVRIAVLPSTGVSNRAHLDEAGREPRTGLNAEFQKKMDDELDASRAAAPSAPPESHYSHLDTRKLTRDHFTPGKFVCPHGACFDHAGNIFVVEWVEVGRVTKLRRTA